MKMNNSLEVLGLVYGAFRIPISIFILEGFMSALPRELEQNDRQQDRCRRCSHTVPHIGRDTRSHPGSTVIADITEKYRPSGGRYP